MTIIEEEDLQTPNEYADCYRNILGINIIPSNGKVPKENWKQFQRNPIPVELHNYWKKIDYFGTGIEAILGRTWHNPERKHLFFFALDIDNEIGIRELLTGFNVESLEELSQKYNLLVVQHGNTKNKCHVYGYASKEIRKKYFDRNKNEIPIIEIKDSSTVITIPPSPYIDGSKYACVGRRLEDLAPQPFDRIENIVIKIYEKYDLLADRRNNNHNGIDIVNGSSAEIIKELIKQRKIVEESNRNNTLFEIARKIRAKNYNQLSEERLKRLLYEWNQNCCRPPLPAKEFNTTWVSSGNYVKGQLKQPAASYPELKDNVFYQSSKKPDKFIVAFNPTKQLIEMVARKVEKSIGDKVIKEYSLVHAKTFLMCIPVQIIRHKNPLSFLDLPARYTISFKDAVGELYTLRHKTLSEILSGLKDFGYVMSDGADGALGAMIQAFKETKEIIDNEDMDYIGFFKDDNNKIIASNIEFKEPVIEDVKDALLFLEQLKSYYENRLDLLSTSIVWGIIAPAIFMLKTNNYFLKWLHFYGFPNSTKSNTGKIILALDGHNENPDYTLNISRIDTIARLGDTLSHTTFPKLVDEVDLNGLDKTNLINNLKSAIEGKIARSKFMNNRASNATQIPALSPLILTSNSPPPYYDAGYMRRVIDRSFPKSESWKENDPKAIEFKEFLRANLKRLKPLGDFRNCFIMNHQGVFLDESRLLPLDLGYKILEEAYKLAGQQIPEWLKQRLPENQLEVSIEDNGVIVKRAFEKYITEQLNRALQLWKTTETEEIKIDNETSHRVWRLAKSNLLPDMKITENYELIIRRGFLEELYHHGLTRDQCPNLKALSDYIGSEYRKSHGSMVVAATKSQIFDYFDKPED